MFSLCNKAVFLAFIVVIIVDLHPAVVEAYNCYNCGSDLNCIAQCGSPFRKRFDCYACEVGDTQCIEACSSAIGKR